MIKPNVRGPANHKMKAFSKRNLLFSLPWKTLSVAIRQLRQIRSHAIVLVCCEKLAPLGWKLSSDSFDEGTSCANPAAGMRAVLEAGQ